MANPAFASKAWMVYFSRGNVNVKMEQVENVRILRKLQQQTRNGGSTTTEI